MLTRPLLTALAWFGAVASVLVAAFLPLPRAVLSEEELAAGRMPQTRQSVEQARAVFSRAASEYRTYVEINDVGAALAKFDLAARALDSARDSGEARSAVQSAADPIIQFLSQLGGNALAGEQYFSALHHYDDELMAWTRSLGSESEALRSATWPIVEYLKVYPPPIGLKSDYDWVSAADVMSRTAALRADVTTGNSERLLSDLQSVREAGRSIEYIESLHDQYDRLLREYDDNLQAVLAARASVEPDASKTIATAVDVAVAVLVGLGIAGLLLPRRRPEEVQA